jgi:beta-glucosidase
MRYFGVLFFITGLFCFLFSETIALSGRVLCGDQSASPIPNATLSFKSQGVTGYTDASGKFTVNFSLTGVMHPPGEKRTMWKISGSKIFFSLSQKKTIAIGLYDIQGKRLNARFERIFAAGTHSIPLQSFFEKSLPAGFLIIKMQVGPDNMTGTYTSVSEGSGMFVDQIVLAAGNTLHSVAASYATDTLVVYRMGYVNKTIFVSGTMNPSLGDIVLNRTQAELDIERKCDSLIGIMTIAQKAAQMAQAQINQVSDDDIAANGYGSVFNGGEQPIVPNKAVSWALRLDSIQSKVLANSSLKIPIIYGIDAVHGNAKVVGSTIFPHNIGLGCTYDTALVRQAGEITAEECAAVGVHWTFAPALSVVRNERWGRTYEGFGETPEICSMMGSAFLHGLQGNGDISKPGAIAACLKHYLGDGATTDGVNTGAANLSEATIRAVHLPPYAAAIRENPATVMPSFTAWSRDGKSIKQSLDTYSLTQMLKQELGFDGFCISDYNAIPLACGNAAGTDYTEDCVAQSVNAGMDMAMIAGAGWVVQTYVSSIVSGVTDNKIPIARINDAVKRILRVKFRMHLWEHGKSEPALRADMGNAEHRTVARECVRKSLVLLKRDGNVLPLGKNEKITVVGPWANSLGLQCGGWTLNWQGNPKYNSDSLPGATTIFQGFKNLGGANVTFDSTGNNLAGCDKIVLFIGEVPYAEGVGDDGFSEASLGYSVNPDWGGAFPNLARSVLLSGQPSYGLLAKCVAAGKPLICVLVTGRPMVISSEDLAKCKALVAAWLPGSEGQGVADVLYGEYNFFGKLTHTWPASKEQIPINAGPTYADEQHGNGGTPLFPLGHGLRY